jgi:hypothetical protein
MKKARKAGSVESAVKAMFDAASPGIEVPTHCNLRAGDMPFWQGIVRARAKDEWTEVDLVIAAQLARCQADIEREQLELDVEGTAVRNERGTIVVNARVSVLEQFARREMALLRSLRMGGRVAGDQRDEAGRRKLQRSAEKVRQELQAEELLA